MKSVTLYFLSPHLSLIAEKVRYLKREMNYLRLIIFFITIWNLTRYVRKLSSGCKGRNSQLKCEAGVGRSSQLWLCICRLQNIFWQTERLREFLNILSFFSVQENFDFRSSFDLNVLNQDYCEKSMVNLKLRFSMQWDILLLDFTLIGFTSFIWMYHPGLIVTASAFVRKKNSKMRNLKKNREINGINM